jgi:ABC-type nitrate/sulfonate/bicarbonate transport system substrate-binding protein
MLAVLYHPARGLTGRVLGLLGLLALVGACAVPATNPPPTASAPTGTAGAAQVAQPTTPPQATHVTVAYPARVVTMTGLYVAIAQGYTREEGLDAEMVLMNGTLSAQGIVAHQVDFGMSAGALLAAHLRGAPIQNVFVQIAKPLFSIFAQPDITEWADLVGKPIGITAVGDSTQLAAIAALTAHGVSPDQVTFIANVTGGAVVAALQAGAVAGAVTAPPADIAAERLGFRDLGFLGDYLDYLSAGLATHEDMIRDHPELVQAVVRAELKAHRFMQQNRAGTLPLMADFQEIEPADAAVAYDRYLKYLTTDGLSTPQQLEGILRTAEQEIQLEQPASVAEAFQLRFARQAAQELDRAGWRP